MSEESKKMKMVSDTIKLFFNEFSSNSEVKDDEKELTFTERKQRYDDAQTILRNETFKTEVKRLINEKADEIVFNSQNYFQVSHLRMTILGVKELVEHLNQITNPESEESKRDIYNSI